MIDFQKCKIKAKDKTALLDNAHLRDLWKGVYDFETGEVMTDKGLIADFKQYGLKFESYPSGTVRFSGSIHNYWNHLNGKGLQNYDDFSYLDIKDCFRSLESEFNIKMDETSIERLEYGVNIMIAKPADSFIKENIITWLGAKRIKEIDFHDKGRYVEFKTSQYRLKLYAKGKKHNEHPNLLRVEIHVSDSRYLKRKGLSKLSDLLNRERLKMLLINLLEAFDKLIIVDHIQPQRQMNQDQTILFSNGINSKYWDSIECRKTKERTLSKFKILLEQTIQDRLKKSISSAITLKWNHLMNSGLQIKKKDNIKHLHLAEHPIRKKQRNDQSNSRNNLARRLDNTMNDLKSSLFKDHDLRDIITLTANQKKDLEVWRGTDHDRLIHFIPKIKKAIQSNQS